MSHGHVVPNLNGILSRCGGPSVCSVCAQEFMNATLEQQQDYLNRQNEKFREFYKEKANETENKKQKQNNVIDDKIDSNSIAALEGKRAWRNNMPVTSNPYSKDSSAHLAWEHAWLKANHNYIFSDPEGL